MSRDTQTAPDQERVCMNCGTWVYYDNGDVTYHCSCGVSGWVWKNIPREKKNAQA